MCQTKPHPWRHPPTQASALASVFGGFATWESQNPRESLAKLRRQGQPPRTGGRAGWSAVWYNLRTGWWIPAKFGTEMANAIFFISYFDKICLTLTGNLWRALACLYSEPEAIKGSQDVGCALTFASEAKFEIEAKLSFRLEAKKKPDFTWFTSMRNTKNLKRKRR